MKREEKNDPWKTEKWQLDYIFSLEQKHPNMLRRFGFIRDQLSNLHSNDCFFISFSSNEVLRNS